MVSIYSAVNGVEVRSVLSRKPRLVSYRAQSGNDDEVRAIFLFRQLQQMAFPARVADKMLFLENMLALKRLSLVSTEEKALVVYEKAQRLSHWKDVQIFLQKKIEQIRPGQVEGFWSECQLLLTEPLDEKMLD